VVGVHDAVADLELDISNGDDTLEILQVLFR